MISKATSLTEWRMGKIELQILIVIQYEIRNISQKYEYIGNKIHIRESTVESLERYQRAAAPCRCAAAALPLRCRRAAAALPPRCGLRLRTAHQVPYVASRPYLCTVCTAV